MKEAMTKYVRQLQTIEDTIHSLSRQAASDSTIQGTWQYIISHDSDHAAECIHALRSMVQAAIDTRP